MILNIISDPEKIKGILNEGKCPECGKKAAVFELSRSGTGPPKPSGELPDMQWVNYKCKNCEKLFKIPIALSGH